MRWQAFLWHKKTGLTYLLRPFSVVFYIISLLRKKILTRRAAKSPLPVIVVGNLSVGGNGKTPVLIALALFLKNNGYNVAIVSRGYKGRGKSFPFWCDANSDPFLCGDEPVMIAKQTGMPVVIDPNRSQAVAAIAKKGTFTLVLSDDGLQHYKMQRDYEIAVIGSALALGNGALLPAGPLREPLSRLKSVDWVLGDLSLPSVKYPIEIVPIGFFHVTSHQAISIEALKQTPIRVMTGIALPERFHQQLKAMGLVFSIECFPDHYHFRKSDFTPYTNELIVMTEKDAVKCSHLALENAYFLKIEIKLDKVFLSELLTKLRRAL